MSKSSFISIRVIAYLYIQHIILLFFAILNCKWWPFSLASATFGRVNIGYKFLQTFGKSTVHLQGLFVLFHPYFIYIRIVNFAKKSFCVDRQLVTESKKDFRSLKMFQRSRYNVQFNSWLHVKGS